MTTTTRGRQDHVGEYLLTITDLAKILKLSRREIWRREAAGTIPRALRLSRSTVRWKGSEVESWLATLQPTDA